MRTNHRVSGLVQHLFIDGFPVSQESKDILYPIFFFNGTLAVWIFFIVSGFSLSIGYAILGNRNILLKIACGRYLRLALPVLVFSLMMYAVLCSGIIPPIDLRPDKFKHLLVEPPVFSDMVFFALFDVFFNYDASRTLIPPLWTISIEWLGSYFVLSLCFFCGGKRFTFVLYSVVFLVSIVFSPMYAAFFAGVLFSEIYSKQECSDQFWVPLFLFAIGSLLASLLLNGSRYLYLIVSILLFYGMVFCHPIRRFFENALSRFMGRISFTLYLLHAIVMWAFCLPLIVLLKKHGVASNLFLILSINFLAIALSVALARLLLFIDDFAVALSRRFSEIIFNLISGLTIKVDFRSKK